MRYRTAAAVSLTGYVRSTTGVTFPASSSPGAPSSQPSSPLRPGDYGNEFQFGIELILDGLETARDSEVSVSVPVRRPNEE